ncbi:NHLP bacteriocin system secretion protein, partial [candidate division KSB3 bacterium]|nr:NHLP bacteriocin system secretion protein [candidate division KSB3 bacterium]MBD3326407.1 NHLP bacteriocin system secretion protein [candidate division KSB3 bacterium]
QLIIITSPLGWLALVAVGGLLAAAVFWGFYGTIPAKVQGQGILLQKGGLVSIEAQNSGTITTINVEVGDIIEKGDIVARIHRDDLLEQIRQAQLELQNFKTSFEEQQKAKEESNQIQIQQLEQEIANNKQQIQNLESQLNTQRTLLRQQEELREGFARLVEDGIFSRNKLLEVENDIVSIQQNINALELEIEKVKNQLNTYSLEIKQIESSKSLSDLEYWQRVDKMRLAVQALQKEFAETSQIVSPYNGKVVEIVGMADALINQGSTVLILEARQEDADLEAILYFSPFTGKKVQPGMSAQVLPTTVKVEEYGFIKGIVTEVDKYPSTIESVLKTLQNQQLVQVLAANAAPIRVKIQLVRDEETPSGYEWSSRQGPPIEINSGTLCSAEVTVKEQAPITLVIPVLKKYLLGFGQSAES